MRDGAAVKTHLANIFCQMEANGSVYEKRVLRENAVFRKKNGALERTRTFTPFGHNHLKVESLPVTPRVYLAGILWFKIYHFVHQMDAKRVR